MKNPALVIGAILMSASTYAQINAPENDSSSKIRLVSIPARLNTNSAFLVMINIKGSLYILPKRAVKLLDTSFIIKSYVVRSNELPRDQRNRLPQIVFNLSDSLPKKTLKKLERYLIPPPL